MNYYIFSCLESCYWHCFEKWFCYDENIALYEDPCVEEKGRRSYDNMAFWDSVAVIANRSIVTIQPLPNKNDSSTILNINNNKLSTESDPDQKHSSDDVDGPMIQTQSLQQTEAIKNSDCVIKITEPTPEKGKVKLRKQSAVDDKIEQRQRSESNAKERIRKQSAIEEMIEQRQRSESNAQDRQRKKPLKERRKSAAGLTLKLDNDFHEIPVIRQSSMPKFFLDTPEIDTLHGNYSGERSSVLVSPVLGNSPTYSFDLKSIVQIENEMMAQQSKPSTPKASRTSSRLNQVRKKLKPIIIKKPSSKSLPDSIHHM